MTIIEVLKSAKDGDKIRRKSWGNGAFYLTVKGNGLLKPDGYHASSQTDYGLGLDGLKADDWYIMESMTIGEGVENFAKPFLYKSKAVVLVNGKVYESTTMDLPAGEVFMI